MTPIINNAIRISANRKMDIARLRAKDPKHIAELNKGDELLRAHWRLIQKDLASIQDFLTKPSIQRAAKIFNLTTNCIWTANGEPLHDLVRRINGGSYLERDYWGYLNADPITACTFAAYSDDDL